MTVMPRIPSRKPRRRRSSFVAPAGRAVAVPDALSWREQLDHTAAPKGPAAWNAASTTQSGRTIIDAGPYGVIDVAEGAALADGSGRNLQLGVVWWDKRSLREEDVDEGSLQTSFVPASITDHVSLAAPSSRPSAPQAPQSPAQGRQSPAHVAPVPTPAPRARPGADKSSPHVAQTGPGPFTGSPFSEPRPANFQQVIEPFLSGTGERPAPVRATRPAEIAEAESTGHVRQSRHVALVPPARGRRSRPLDVTHPRRARLRRRRTRRRAILGVVLVVLAFLVTVLIQTAVITPFTVPSVSMENTLHTDDRIIVDRFAYTSSPVARGDVVVFTDPGGWLTSHERGSSGGDGYVVKRVIGVPGDHVACCSTSGRVTVNGREIDERYAIVPAGQPAAETPFDVTVPAGDLWVLGDNRYHSRDSSQTKNLPSKGFVPIANVVGRAAFTVWPLTQLSAIGTARETFSTVPDATCPI